MTSSHNLNPQQLKAYRDDTVNALNKQINLLREIRKSDLMQNRSAEGKQGLLTIEEIDKAILKTKSKNWNISMWCCR